MPGFPESESKIGNDITGTSSNILGISNRKNRFSRYVKNMWQPASNRLVLSDLEFALCGLFLYIWPYLQNRGQAPANALSVKSDLFCSNLINENTKKNIYNTQLK